MKLGDNGINNVEIRLKIIAKDNVDIFRNAVTLFLKRYNSCGSSIDKKTTKKHESMAMNI